MNLDGRTLEGPGTWGNCQTEMTWRLLCRCRVFVTMLCAVHRRPQGGGGQKSSLLMLMFWALLGHGAPHDTSKGTAQSA